MGESSALSHYARPLIAALRAPGVTELCINRPGEVWVETESGWRRDEPAWATYEWGLHFSRLMAASSQQRLTVQHPLLSAALPDGERVQIVLPPATRAGCVVMSIRKNRCGARSLSNLVTEGLTSTCQRSVDSPMTSPTLSRAYASGDWELFLRESVRARLNILVSGATGAGKTTLTRALIGEIDRQERLVTIEDTPELELADDLNAVRLFYSKDDQGLSRLTPRNLLEASLRLRPERILLAELRGDEAYQYLRAINSGHPGSITSIHASSCRLAFEQLSLLVKESDAGRDMPRADIHQLLRQVVDVVVHCDRRGGRRQVREIWWRDATDQAERYSPAL